MQKEMSEIQSDMNSKYFIPPKTSIDAFYVNDFRYKEERWWERAQIDRERMEENDPFILFFQELPVGDWVNFCRCLGIGQASISCHI